MRKQGPVGATQNLKETTQRQKEEWRRQKEYWKDQKRTLKQEWRHTWDDVWTTATGSADDAARVKLDRALRKFVEDVRAAARAGVDEEQLGGLRELLTETSERVRLEIFHSDEPDPRA
jgi:hypothetical protein